MRAYKHNPHPVDQKDFFAGKLTVVGGRDFEQEESDEDFTEAPATAPTFRSNLLRLRKSVSEKLFSIDLGKISF